MPEPITIIAASLGIASSGLTTTLTLLKLAQEIKEVPEDSKIFVRILDQVNRDIAHAAKCYEEVSMNRLDHPTQSGWILEVITAAIHEVDNFGHYVSDFSKSHTPDLIDRVGFLLNNYKALVNRERALRFAHSRLLTVIGTMHIMALQLSPSSSNALSPVPARPLRRRASRAPPQYYENVQSVTAISEITGTTNGEKVESVIISVEGKFE
ncbi:hypothetical protein F4805DRAFT_144672 [Annulohypoxylon moriforme]|nr:hypothetical protein F4805DRAFT_144672 [Annulohypoxylon moriforme]